MLCDPTGLRPSSSASNNNDEGQMPLSGTPQGTFSSSVIAYRDKLGLHSPSAGHPSPAHSRSSSTNNIKDCMSPASAAEVRSPSRSSTSGEAAGFRHPSGASTSSTGSSPRRSAAGEGGCATPLSVLSSREGTPLHKVEEAAAGVDVASAVGMQHTSGKLDSDKMETGDSVKQEQPASKEPVKKEPGNFEVTKPPQMGYPKQEFNNNFQNYIQKSADQSKSLLHQNQLVPHTLQHHYPQYSGFGGNNNNSQIPLASEVANNNLLACQGSLGLQQRASNNLYGPRASYQHAGGYSGALHYQGSGGLSANRPTLGSSAAAVRTAGSVSRSGSQVKIGRRPSHLPKVLKFQDGTLPPGWIRKLKCRKHGKQAGRWDVYIYSPCGVKFASRKKLKSFFEKNNLNYDPEDFDFTPYGRHSDHAAAGRGGSGGSGSSSSSAAGGSSGSSRHNSSGSSGSDTTHTSSPASLHNFSPPHLTSNAAPYLAHSMIGSPFANTATEFAPFGSFSAHVESHANGSAMAAQQLGAFGANANGCPSGNDNMVSLIFVFK
jgi:hypothetical protein